MKIALQVYTRVLERKGRQKMINLGWVLIFLSIVFWLLLDPLIHIFYYRLIPFAWVNEQMPRRGSVFEYSELAIDILAGWFVALAVLGVTLLCAGALAKLRSTRGEKPEKRKVLIGVFRMRGLGVASGILAIFSIVANNVAGPSIRDSFPDPRLLNYLASQSVSPGDEMISYTNSPMGDFTSEIVRLSAEERVIVRSTNVPRVTQPQVGGLSYLGAKWEPDTYLQLVAPEEPGIYAHRVSNKSSSFDSVFCVKPRVGEGSEIALLLNTNTWAAYNGWGGASLYRWNNGKNTDPQPQSVSFLRPNPNSQPNINNHLVGGELHFSRWLDSSSVEFDCITDLDLHSDPVSSEVKLLVLSTHPEYWSGEMYDHLEAFLDSGGSLLYVGGNGIYWKSDLSSEGLIQVNRAGGELWRNLGRPQSAILGVNYGSDDYGTYAPFVVEDSGHFLFKGLGLTNGDTFGNRSLIGPGASGWETDKSDSNSPVNGSVLARGLNEPEGGHVFFYRHAGGGLVLSFGSITSAAAIPIDVVMQGIFWNYLNAIGIGR